MEKYRKFGDAATGINPFISMKTPTAFSTLFAAVLFPVRCVIAVVIMSLLFLVDTFNYLFYLLPGLSSLSHLLFGGLQRGLLRGLLFSLGNVSIARVPTSGSLSPSAGDVVVANLQSVWDMCVIEVAEQIPLFVAAFYGGKAGSSPEKSKKDEDGTLFVMEPSPLQRWRVWWHIYNTGTSTFLSTVADDSSNAHSGEALPIDITLLQRRCHRLGVPLVLFAEGSCTNGKGMLNISPIRVGVTPARLLVSALSYDTAALHTVVRPHSVLSYLFSMSASLYGSRDPAWYSPQFPTATARLASVGTDPPAEAVEGVVVVEGTKVRQVLCGISRPRCALNVGLREKRRFVEVFMAHKDEGRCSSNMTSVKETKEPKPSINRARDLPWWKRLVLDPSYRKRVRRIATECYRKEMSVVRDFPEKLFSAEREYGVPLVSSSQYVQLEGESKWATRHPSTIMKTSSLKTLRDSATTTVLPVFGQDHESRVDDEIKRLFQQEKADNRLYGLSYIWDEQLPPMGFIRQWPPPHQGMWPTGCVHRQLQKVQLPSDRKAREALAHNPLFVHIYRQGGEFLGVWRQSLLLLRYKIICCALHEEALGSRNPNGEKKSSTRRAHLMYVPEFTSPLLRLQGDTTVSVMEGRVNVETISPPTTWEGLAPSPSKVHVDQGYLNWCAFHNSSPMVRQSVRDVYNMLPHDEDGRLTKDVFVEFVLDLLNLFFPLNNSASNIAIAEEEWAFRGTSELVSFDTFFEKFFSFPFIFLRNFEEVTRDMYVEVWCLIRICLLETEHTIHSSSRGITTNVTEVLKQRLEQDYEQTATRALHRIPKQRSFTLNGGNSNANLDFQMVPKPKMAPLHSKGRPPPQQPRDIPALISGINGFTAEDVINLGCTDFHNTDNYKTYAMKRRILEECEDAPYKIPSSRQVLFAHKKAERLLAEDREANQLESPQIFLEVEEANDSLGTYVLGSPSSSTTGSVKSHNNRMESMKKRRDALEELENRHTIEKLLATSYWYRRRRQQRKKALNDAHTLVSRCHTSWEMFQYDVYEIPEENPTEVDDLIAFVLDLPDDFFVVDTSLRMRNTVYRVHESVRESRLPKVRKVDELQLFEERIKKEAESLWRERLYGTEKQSVKEGDSEAAQPEGSSTTVDDEVPPRLPAKGKRGFTSPKCGASPSSPRQRPGETGRLRPLLSALSKSPPRLDTTALVESPCRNGGCETPKPDRVTARRRREELEEEERILQKKEERVLGMRLRLKERMDAEYMRRVKLKSQRRSIPLVIRAAQRKNVD